jgi:hypothetical protein
LPRHPSRSGDAQELHGSPEHGHCRDLGRLDQPARARVQNRPRPTSRDQDHRLRRRLSQRSAGRVRRLVPECSVRGSGKGWRPADADGAGFPSEDALGGAPPRQGRVPARADTRAPRGFRGGGRFLHLNMQRNSGGLG